MIHTVKREALVSYTPAQMYKLVNGVEAYPEFVPGCKQGRVLSATDSEIVASLVFSSKGIHKTFTTRNQLDENKSIKLVLVDGPFKRLDGLWQFKALPDNAGCQVSLDLEFELSNEWLNKLFGRLFSEVANKLVNVFCERADQIYGNNTHCNNTR